MTVEEFLEWQYMTVQKEKADRAFYAACHGVKMEDEEQASEKSLGEFLSGLEGMQQ